MIEDLHKACSDRFQRWKGIAHASNNIKRLFYDLDCSFPYISGLLVIDRHDSGRWWAVRCAARTKDGLVDLCRQLRDSILGERLVIGQIVRYR